MRYYLVLFLFAAGIAISVRAPVFGACFFLWNNIFQPLSFARNPWAFPAAQVVLAVLVGSYAIGLLRGTFKPRGSFLLWYMIPMLGWILVTALVSSVPHSIDGFIEIVKYLGPLMLISTSLRNVNDVRMLSLVLTLSVGVWSTQAGIHGAVKGVAREMSIPGGQMTDNNDFMAATVSIIPMLFYFIFSYRWKYRAAVRVAGAVMTVAAILAIIFSNSRGAALGLALTAVLYVVFVSKSKARDGIAIVALIGIIVLFLPDTFWDRMRTIRLGEEQTEGSAAERMHMMKSAWRCVLDKPYFGVGPDCWLSVAAFYSGGLALDPHNLWLKLTTEIGVPGLLLYLGALGGTIGRLNSIRRKAARLKDKESVALATTFIMAIVGFLMPSTFLSHPFSEFLWAWLFISNAYATIYGRVQLSRPKGPGGLAAPARPRPAPPPEAPGAAAENP